jgi:hypothetical protein
MLLRHATERPQRTLQTLGQGQPEVIEPVTRSAPAQEMEHLGLHWKAFQRRQPNVVIAMAWAGGQQWRMGTRRQGCISPNHGRIHMRAAILALAESTSNSNSAAALWRR